MAGPLLEQKVVKIHKEFEVHQHHLQHGKQSLSLASNELRCADICNCFLYKITNTYNTNTNKNVKKKYV